MSKKVEKIEVDYVGDDGCTQYDCGACFDKFECDYYIQTYCQPMQNQYDRNSPYNNQYPNDGGQGGYGCGANLPANQQQADGIQQQNQTLQQGQGVAAGYGYVGNTPVPNPNNGNGVQLSPIVIPVSFVPYTTQNQPLYQVETVMPEKGYIKHHGLSLFMLALSVAAFFLFAFPMVSEFTGYNLMGGLSSIVGMFGFMSGGGFEALFTGQDAAVITGASLASISVLMIFIASIYNGFKYIVKSINGRLKKGPNLSNAIILICVITLFIAVAALNSGSGKDIGEILVGILKNDASLVYRLNFGYYALLCVSVILTFVNSFIVTEKYLPVEGAIEE
ncbi:MAG: hypothetical protein LBQ27_03190 [Clostridiales bacterium]|jgi:hypothetical protein|nr:hypothetical protein [Clostridiales bacterium]